jgi:hypothetical protein
MPDARAMIDAMTGGWAKATLGLGLLAGAACLDVPPAESGATDATSTSSASDPSHGTSSEVTSDMSASEATTSSTEPSSTASTDTGAAEVDGLVLSSSRGTDLPAGATTEIVGTVVPAEAAGLGLEFTVSTSVGFVRGPSGDAPSLMLSTEADGSVTFGLRVPVDTPPGTVVTIESDAPQTSGDTELTVVAPVLTQRNLDGVAYEVADGFELTAALMAGGAADPLVGRRSLIAIPPEGSAFPPVVHIVSEGTPPYLHRVEDESLVFVSTSPGNPDEGVAQIGFSDPEGEHGDRLFVCSASPGAGDGVFTIDPAGQWADWLIFNNCNGIALDETDALMGSGGASTLYLNVSSDVLQRIVVEGMTFDSTDLFDDLGFGPSGYRLYLNDREPFDPGLYLLFPRGDVAEEGSGSISVTAPGAAAWAQPSPLVVGLGNPDDLVFAAGSDFGSSMYVTLRDSGEIRGYRANFTSFALASGLDGSLDVEIEADGRTMWVLEGGRGRLLRLTWTP